MRQLITTGLRTKSFSISPDVNFDGFEAMPFSSIKPRAFYNPKTKEYKSYSWVNGLSNEPLLEEPIGKWFETQVVSSS